MVFSLEVLQAFHGDSLLLHAGDRLCLIDGGPVNTWATSLRPRLEQLRAARAPGDALRIDLAMVSHIDADHIQGLDRHGRGDGRARRRPPAAAVHDRQPLAQRLRRHPRRPRRRPAHGGARRGAGRPHPVRDRQRRPGPRAARPGDPARLGAQPALRRARGRPAVGAVRGREADRRLPRRGGARQAARLVGVVAGPPSRGRPGGRVRRHAPSSTSRASSCSPRPATSGCCCAATPAATTCSKGSRRRA